MDKLGARKMMELFTGNATIFDSVVKANSIVNSRERERERERVMCSVSGGRDSDTMMDLIWTIDTDNKVKYVFFDTGLEYQATKEHLEYLEEKYSVEIIRERPDVPIPMACKKYGQPFLSKTVSEFIDRLQKHNFEWEDWCLDDLLKKYDNCRAALRWFTSDFTNQMSIRYNKLLREFLIEHQPEFKISSQCCTHAKKNVAKKVYKKYAITLNIMGIRKAEGGARSYMYKTCFDLNESNKQPSQYRPLFWYKKTDIEEYETIRNIENSKCYTVYGLKRTGCAGCPFSGINLDNELMMMMMMHEPRLYKACNYIFEDSYKYRERYKKYIDKEGS